MNKMNPRVNIILNAHTQISPTLIPVWMGQVTLHPDGKLVDFFAFYFQIVGDGLGTLIETFAF